MNETEYCYDLIRVLTPFQNTAGKARSRSMDDDDKSMKVSYGTDRGCRLQKDVVEGD